MVFRTLRVPKRLTTFFWKHTKHYLITFTLPQHKCLHTEGRTLILLLRSRKWTFKGPFSERQQYIPSVRRHLCWGSVKVIKYCTARSENLHTQSTKPGEYKKSKIIEFRSIMRNIELFEVLRFSKNQRFYRKTGDLEKKHSCFL